MSAALDELQIKAARAVHAQQNRLERSQALFVILGEPDASVERVAQFMCWADAYQESAVEIAVETVYLETSPSLEANSEDQA